MHHLDQEYDAALPAQRSFHEIFLCNLLPSCPGATLCCSTGPVLLYGCSNLFLDQLLPLFVPGHNEGLERHPAQLFNESLLLPGLCGVAWTACSTASSAPLPASHCNPCSRCPKLLTGSPVMVGIGEFVMENQKVLGSIWLLVLILW